MQLRVTAVTDDAQQRHDRMVAAFARAASSIAWQGSLQVVLDQLADEARTVSGADTCTVSLRSRLGDTFEMVGAAGCPDGYREQLQQARALKAPLSTEEVYRTGVGFIADIDTALEDARLAPLVDLVRRAGWRTLVAVPLTVRDETVGALTAFYTEGNKPNSSDISFLTAMADHGALAVHTARLLAQAKDKAALEERAHMARDLHDAVSQLLFSMQLRARALQLEADRPGCDTARLSAGLKELNAVIGSAVEEMRALILHLRPAQLSEDTLAAALERLAETVRSREDVDIVVQAADDIPPLVRPYDEHLYRITQEAIGNAVNHAGAHNISITLSTAQEAGGETLMVEIADDGAGFDPNHSKPGHRGLANMRARCGELGGVLGIDSSPQGTRIHITVPLDRGVD